MLYQPRWRFTALFATPALCAVLLILLAAGQAQAKPAPPKPQTPSRPDHALADQIIPGFPLSMTVEDRTSIQIRYRDYGDQFFGSDAEGVYLWALASGVVKVYGPGQVPAGNATNPYAPVSNVVTGFGTPSAPWVATTVVLVPDTD